MTYWDVVWAVITALCIFRLFDIAVDAVAGYFSRRKIDKILDDLHEFWEEQQELKKPVKKKAVAKKK